jgi:hypothetical protein
VEIRNWEDRSKEKALVNLGGGPRPTPKTEKGVPIYVHDWFGPGRTALVVSTRSPEYKAQPDDYRSVPSLTGDESRAAAVSGIDFPEPLTPVDEEPPQTVITHVVREPSALIVRGSVADNGEIKRVIVNGQEARLDRESGQWEVRLPRAGGGPLDITAHGEDAAGNVEQLAHRASL